MAESAQPFTESTRDAGIQRVWLDWNLPLMRQAAAWLLDRAEREDGLLRLDRFACITPGRRAGRVLLEETLRQCQARGEHMAPFRPLTPGAMVDALIERDAESLVSRATDIESELAWIAALQKQSEATLSALLTSAPDRDDRAGWLALARTIHRLHVELTGQRKRFADVAQAVDQLGRETERARWEELEAIARDYRTVLAKLPGGGLIDAEIDREQAAANGALPEGLEVVLVGVTEMNQVQRTFISRMHDRTTVLIHAPQEHAAGFDALGCIDPAYWANHVIDLCDEQIIVADKPGDQAQQVMRELARLSARGSRPLPNGRSQADSRQPTADGRLPIDHVTIGVEEAALTDQLELAAKWAKVHIHRAEGERLDRTPPYRLLEALADWLEEPSFASFAAIVRHPAVEHWLHEQFRHVPHDEAARKSADWLTLLDRYFADHLHERLTGEWLGRERDRERLRMLHDAITNLVRPLRESRAKPLREWAEPILNVLAEIYAPVTQVDEREADDRAIDACRAIRDGLSELDQVHEALQPSVRSHEAVRIVLDMLREQTLPMRPRADQIESLGWLELHADLAPVLIIMGVNDGVIPKAVTSDPFLPNTLRTQLGLMDNVHRYARDIYRLEAINRSREKLIVITGRRSEDGEPLPPSRLLLACERERLPGRVRMLSDEDRAKRFMSPLGMDAPDAEARSMFLVPEPPSESPVIEKMSVTSFRLYLACPYRFWLERVLRLQAFEDAAIELDSLQFGSFIHSVLETFGNDEAMRDCNDADAIRAFLRDATDGQARLTFGTSPMPAVRVQLDRVRRRLNAFAACQAAMRRDGWRIEHCELVLPEHVALDLPDDAPIRITGKIDRIDRHVDTGAFRIIDYKTGNNPTTPMEAHHPGKTKRDEWVDLQLPLYHYLAQQIDVSGAVDVGYIVLPRDPDLCGWLPANWQDHELAAAIDVARQVVHDVREEKFWPPSDVFGRNDPYANICQTNVFGRDDFGEETGDSADGGEGAA